MANAIALFLVMMAQVMVIVQLLISQFWGKVRARVPEVEQEPEQPEEEEEEEEQQEEEEQYGEYERARAVDHLDYEQPAYSGGPQYRTTRVPRTLQPSDIRMMCRLPPERTRTEVFYRNPNFARSSFLDRHVGSGRRQDP